jgi:hypothetical protein
MSLTLFRVSSAPGAANQRSLPTPDVAPRDDVGEVVGCAAGLHRTKGWYGEVRPSMGSRLGLVSLAA